MQAPVGVVVEGGGVVGGRGTVDSVARGVRFWQLMRLGVALLRCCVWAGRGWLEADASAVGVSRVA